LHILSGMAGFSAVVRVNIKSYLVLDGKPVYLFRNCWNGDALCLVHQVSNWIMHVYLLKRQAK